MGHKYGVFCEMLTMRNHVYEDYTSIQLDFHGNYCAIKVQLHYGNTIN